MGGEKRFVSNSAKSLKEEHIEIPLPDTARPYAVIIFQTRKPWRDAADLAPAARPLVTVSCLQLKAPSGLYVYVWCFQGEMDQFIWLYVSACQRPCAVQMRAHVCVSMYVSAGNVIRTQSEGKLPQIWITAKKWPHGLYSILTINLQSNKRLPASSHGREVLPRKSDGNC